MDATTVQDQINERVEAQLRHKIKMAMENLQKLSRGDVYVRLRTNDEPVLVDMALRHISDALFEYWKPLEITNASREFYQFIEEQRREAERKAAE